MIDVVTDENRCGGATSQQDGGASEQGLHTIPDPDLVIGQRIRGYVGRQKLAHSMRAIAAALASTVPTSRPHERSGAETLFRLEKTPWRTP